MLPSQMLRRVTFFSRHGHGYPFTQSQGQVIIAAVPRIDQNRSLVTLAIETSCDDTSVAILETNDDDCFSDKQGSRLTVAPQPAVTVHFLDNITADTRQYLGIHPISALVSHQESLAKLIKRALNHLPLDSTTCNETTKPGRNTIEIRHDTENVVGGGRGSSESGRSKTSQRRKLPDFISVTRGPGMRSNLTVGLETAKGLAVAWQVPLVGVHHMQAHLLTPRLVSALNNGESQSTTLPTPSAPIITSSATTAATTITTMGMRTTKLTESTEKVIANTQLRPDFPFLSVLVSGGHSMLVMSRSITDHKVLATTADIAIGEALDKSARLILPESVLQTAKNTMYGKLLEEFAFPNGPADYARYRPPKDRGEEQAKPKDNNWGWSITTPFANTRTLQFSFSSVPSTVARILEKEKQQQVGEEGREKEADHDDGGSGQDVVDVISLEERREMAREVMRVCFEHLASRTIIALENLRGNRGQRKSRSEQRRRRHSRKELIRKQQNPQGQRNDQSLPLQVDQSSEESQIRTLVISGGVAANHFLMAVLQSSLDVRGFTDIKIIAPPPSLCTDNAAMIGWAGLEMYQAGWTTDLGCQALKKWTLDPHAADRGIVGVSGWIRHGVVYDQDFLESGSVLNSGSKTGSNEVA